MEEIAELLRETREEAGIDLDEVSKDIEINKIALENIEAGKIGAFKNIFLLKDYLYNYAKYLGLNPDEILSEFNEYVFEFTSKIPVKEIEKTLELAAKNGDNDSVVSPYTAPKRASKKSLYVLIYILIFVLVILAIFWSVNQITINKSSAYIISYGK